MLNRHSAVILVSRDPAGIEPAVALLRGWEWRPVVVQELSELLPAMADGTARLAILSGDFEFCQPFLAVFTERRARQTTPPFVILASGSSEAFAIAALRAGASDYFPQPPDLATFAQSISRWTPECVATPAKTELAGGEVLVGASPVMQALRAQIRQVAATDCNVLITGETGTGKELVAQLIHQNSPRRGYPLICINCAAIPEALVESELFGYERGAFTGASLANQGKLMAANRGTVFFDEIGDMSPLAQAKILRAIETKEVQRLGTTRRYDTDIRILGATHHNLDDLASAETFRRDLYFRLNVGRIYLPPLRERKCDIADLVERMVSDLNRKMDRRVDGVTSAAVRWLAQYDWPGNVRELKNVTERMLIVRETGRISEDDVARILPSRRASAGPAGLGTTTAADGEMRMVQAVLDKCNGNKSKAAERLNWSRMTLYRKLAKYKCEA